MLLCQINFRSAQKFIWIGLGALVSRYVFLAGINYG
jgi:hypothetical protein